MDQRETGTEASCKHWWVIESPNGEPELLGRCKFCGKSRMFQNKYMFLWGEYRGGPLVTE